MARCSAVKPLPQMDFPSPAKTGIITVYVYFNCRNAELKKASFHLHLLPVCPRGIGGRCCHSQQWGNHTYVYVYAFKLIFLLLLWFKTLSLSLLLSIFHKTVQRFDLIRYGDVTPKSLPGRVFAIIWVLVGAVVMSLFTATVISAMETAVDGKKCTDIDGKEVNVNYRLVSLSLTVLLVP